MRECKATWKRASIYSQGVGQAVAALDDVIAFVKYFSTFAFLTFSLGVESLSLCHFSDLSLGVLSLSLNRSTSLLLYLKKQTDKIDVTFFHT